MNGKKAKKLRKISKALCIGKSKEKIDKVYKRMKSIKVNKK